MLLDWACLISKLEDTVQYTTAFLIENGAIKLKLEAYIILFFQYKQRKSNK